VSKRFQVEKALRTWLRGHYSVIGYREALTLGATRATIQYKFRSGEWLRPYQGVYCDSASAPSPEQELRAAWLATGGCAVASHLSAAWLWDLIQRTPPRPELTVSRGTHDVRGHSGILVHRSRDLDASGWVNRHGILVTNPLRTLVDLAGVAVPAQLTEAVDSALARRLVTVAGLQAEIGRLAGRGRPGVGVLRLHLSDRGFLGDPPASVLEAHGRRLVLRTTLPVPAIEVRVGEDGEYRLDIAWPAILFAVEVDGYLWHFSPEQMQRDVTRRNDLQQRGWTVLVYTWRQVVKEPARVADEITRTYRRLESVR
jgi:hypothetical protein